MDPDHVPRTRAPAGRTQHTPAADAAWQERQLYEAALQALPGVFYIFDENGKFLKWNRNLEVLTGYTAEEIAQQTPFDHLRKDCRERVRQRVQEVFTKGSSSVEVVFVSRTGQETPYDCHGQRIVLDGKPYLLGLGIDISERKRTEANLEHTRLLLEALLEQSPAPIVVASAPDTVIRYANQAAREQLGVSDEPGHIGLTLSEVAARQTWQDLRPDGTPIPLADLPLGRATRGEATRNEEYGVIRKDGTKRWQLVSGTPVFDRDGALVAGLIVFPDITARKHAEQDVRQSEERFRRVAELTGQLLYDWDFASGAVHWSGRLQEITGYALEEMNARGLAGWQECVHPEDIGHAMAELDVAIRDRRTHGCEYRFRKADGTYMHVSDEGACLYDEAGRAQRMLGVIKDVTERRQAEARVQGLNRLKEELLGPGDLDAKLRRITDGVVEIFDADFARIWLTLPGDRCSAGCIHAASRAGPHVCRQRDRCLHLVASSGRYTHLDGSIHQRVPFGCYKIGRIATGDEPSFLTNAVAEDPRVHDHEWARQLGLVSFAGYRLLSAAQETIGVLALFSRQPLSTQDDQLLATVAATTSEVILAAQAEQALRESEQRYRNFVANASEGIYRIDFQEPIPIDLPPEEAAARIDRHAIIGEVNEALAGMYGLRPADMIGRPATDFAPDCGKRAALLLQRENYQVSDEKTIDHDKDGRPIYLTESATGLVEDGHLIRIWGVQRDITQQRQAELSLCAAEERWLFALEGAGDGVWDWNAQTDEVFFSRQWKAMLGYAEHEIGATLAEWESRVHPDDRARVRAELQRHLSGQTAAYISEHRMRCKDGTWKWILDRGKVVSHTPDGRPLRIVGTHSDLTDRKQAQETLQLNEARLEALLQLNHMTEATLAEIAEFAMEEAVRLTRSQIGYIAFASEDESVLTMFAWSKGAMAECAVQDRPVEYVVTETGLWGEAVRQRRPIITNDYAAPNPWKKGTPTGHVAVRRHMNVPVFDGDRIVLVAGVGNKDWDYDESDVRQLTLLMSGMWRIVQRRRAEERRRESETKYRALFEAAGDAIFLVDAQGDSVRVVECNQRAADLFGVPREQLGQLAILDLAPPEQADGSPSQPAVAARIAQALQGTTQRFEWRHGRPDGSVFDADVTLARVPFGSDRHLLAVVRDITGRKRAEDELRESERKYRDLSQEFQSILGAIPGSLVLLSPDLRIVWANEFAATSMGRTPASILGEYCYGFRHDGSKPCDGCPVLRCFASGQPESSDSATPDGRVWELHTAPVFGEQGEISGVIEIAYEVTEYRRAERELKDSESRLRGLFQAAPIGIIFVKNRTTVSVNEFLCNLLGYSQAELLGHPTRHLYFTAEEFEEVGRRLYGPASAGGHNSFESRLRRKDGTAIEVLFTGAPLCPEDPAAGHVVTVHDITERKRAEVELLREKQFTEKLLESLPGIFFLYDSTCHLKRWNKAHETAMGFTADELRDWYIPDWHETPQDAAIGMALVKSVLETGVAGSFETTLINKEGRFVPYLISVTRLITPDGSFMMGIGIDITQRKQIEEERRRLTAILDSTSDVVVMSNPAGGLFYLNAAGRRVLAWDQTSPLDSHDLNELYPTWAYNLLRDEALPAVHRTGSWQGETAILGAGGREIPVSQLLMAHRATDGQIEHYSSIMRDITERKRAEEARAKLEAQLHQSQKMEAIGQLAGGVAHDFNNILTAVFGQVDLAVRTIEAQHATAHNVLDSLRQIERSAQRASALTRQLLAFSRRQVVQPEVLDLNTTLRDLEKMLRRLLTEDITLEENLAPDLATIKADAGQLEQIIINLAVNARDAMPNGGQLTITTGNATLDDAYAALRTEVRPGPYVVLAVSDTGCGMDRSTLEHVFEPFFTTKPVGQGTGLGLSTVYGIVKQAGGHVTVYSEPGRGSTFRVYLPAAQEPLSLARLAAAAPAPAGSETLIVCEDDNAVRHLTARMLAEAGYTVLAAPDAKHALQLASAHAGPIQLLITDVIMPGLNGRQLSETLAQQRPGIRTLFVSGYTSDVIAHHGVLDENVHFLEKPYGRQRLLRKIREVLDAPSAPPNAPRSAPMHEPGSTAP